MTTLNLLFVLPLETSRRFSWDPRIKPLRYFYFLAIRSLICEYLVVFCSFMLALRNCLLLLYMFCLRVICYCLIQLWDLDTFECTMTLNAHTDAVTSLICWDRYLLSGSSDCTIKIWYKNEEGALEVAYLHNLEM